MKSLKDIIADLQKNDRFKTTNGQLFYAAPYDRPWNNERFIMFKIGTVNGIWRSDKKAIIVLAVANDKPGNGHLEDFFDWFETACVQAELPLIIQEVGSLENAAFDDFKISNRFANYLVQKRGFKQIEGTNDYIKDLKSIQQDVEMKLKDKIYIK